MTIAHFTGRWGVSVQADEGRVVSASCIAKSFADPRAPPHAKPEAARATALLTPSSAAVLRHHHTAVIASLKATLGT